MVFGPLLYRKAQLSDVSAIVKIYSEDIFGSRENFQQPIPEQYVEAFKKIDANATQELMVVEYKKTIIATFQLSYLTYLSYQGGTRLLVENVYVDKNYTSKGVGKQMFEYIFQMARLKGIHLVQLTTNKQRSAAKRFYESLGFSATHEGMKIFL